MISNKELQIAYGLAIILLVVGVLSYAAFSAKAPDQPVRLMFKCVAGKILFDHKTHTVDSSCSDCHHNLEEGETDPQTCGECHEPESQDEDVLNRADAFHTQCIGCHKEEAGPEKCELCHVM
ncbi:MAG: cytochrome c3 family protein [Desulfobacteraceae bacterium]|nr:cytochrome c3 family protein [Desulfobacteraceae bacterium]